MNAILTAKEPLTGYTLYVWPMPPCERCAAHVIQSGIKHVIAPPIKETDRWFESCTNARKMFDEAGVTWEELEP